MKVNGKNLTTIWYDEKEDHINIIDQTLLPHQLEIKSLKTLEDAVVAIKDMLVRGAPLIGVTAAYGMYLASKKDTTNEYLFNAAELLKKTRPTAVNLSWAVDKIISTIKKIDINKRSKLILSL